MATDKNVSYSTYIILENIYFVLLHIEAGL